MDQTQNKKRYAKNGCYAFIKEKGPPQQLPLQSFHYDIQLVDCFAQVKLTQIYYNHLNQSLDVQYIFPIHPGSAVTQMVIEFGGQRVIGVIKQKEEAKKQYDQLVKDGVQASYGEYNPNSRDIVKIKIGNIKPKTQVKIFVSYVHLNSLVCNTFYEYKLASSMTPRYACNVDPSQIQYLPQFNTSNKMVESRCYWSLKLTIKSKNKIIKLQSSTHKINKKDILNGKQITFAQKQYPNKDFTLCYTFQNYQKPTYLVSHSDNKSIATISFIPKYCDLTIDDALNSALKGQSNFQTDLDSSRGEYIFLLDRSGSMQGDRIQNAKRSLDVFLRSLPDGSYFNVISFGTHHQFLFKDSVKNTKQNVDKAVLEMSKVDANMGGTEILGALRQLAKFPIKKDYPKILFLLTDGAVSNVNQVLQFVAKHTHTMRVNAIGIGNGCSEQLIKGCAEKGRGYSIFLKDQQRPQKKIINILENTLSPVITSFELIYDKSKVQTILPNPQKMPFILKNDLAVFYIEFKEKISKPFSFQIRYKDTKRNQFKQKILVEYKNELDFPWLHKLTKHQKIKTFTDCIQQNEAQQDRIFYVKPLNKDDLKKQIIRESVVNQVLSDYTAFLCVNESQADIIKSQYAGSKKQNINIFPMAPYDYQVQIINERQGYDYQNDSDYYIDECCIANYELPPAELEGLTKFQETPKIHRPMMLRAKIAGQKDKYLQVEGVKQFPNPEKRLAYTYIIKAQQTDGSWTEDFIDSLFLQANQFRKIYKKYITNQVVLYTFLVCQFLIRYYPNEAQFSMIIKKGKNYVDKNSSSKWKDLEVEFNKIFLPLKP